MSETTGQALDPLDLGDFGTSLEPPTFAPLVDEFRAQLPELVHGLDASIVALELEAAFDIGGELGGALGDFTAGTQPVASTQAVADLAAMAGRYERLRVQLADIWSYLPPESTLPPDHPINPRPG